MSKYQELRAHLDAAAEVVASDYDRREGLNMFLEIGKQEIRGALVGRKGHLEKDEEPTFTHD
jgi:hypothetical protein